MRSYGRVTRVLEARAWLGYRYGRMPLWCLGAKPTAQHCVAQFSLHPPDPATVLEQVFMIPIVIHV